MLETTRTNSNSFASGLIAYPFFSSGFVDPGICECRLTLFSGGIASDEQRQTTSGVIISPYKGNRVSLFISGSWQLRTVPFNQFVPLSASGITSGILFDCYLTDTTGQNNVQLVLMSGGGPTTRILQDGVIVLSGNLGYRYVGTGYSFFNNQITDQDYIKHLYNYYNRISRSVFDTFFGESTTWSGGPTGGSGWQQSLSISGQAFCSVVIGVPEDTIDLTGSLEASNTTALVNLGIGIATIPTVTAGLNGVNPSGLIFPQTHSIGAFISTGGSVPLTCYVSYTPVYGINNFYLWQFQVSSGNTTWLAGRPSATPQQAMGGMAGSCLM